MLNPTASTYSGRREESTGERGEDQSAQEPGQPSHAQREQQRPEWPVKEKKATDIPITLMGRGLSRFGTLQSLMRTECVYTSHAVSVSAQESTLFKPYFV